MKVAPFYVSKKSLLKKIEANKQFRIQEYLSISNDLDKGVTDFANENADTISRIGERFGVRIGFVKEGSGPQLYFYNKELGYTDSKPYGEISVVDVLRKITNVPDLNNKRDALQSIRKNARNVVTTYIENLKKQANITINIV